MDDNDNTTQEILPGPARAVDGGIVPSAAMTGGQFLDMLDEGALGAELHVQLRDLAATMQDIGNATGNKTKGKVTIVIDLTREDNAFRIGTNVKVSKPEMPKPRSIMFTDEHNRFTRFPPNQGQFFGMRNVGGAGGVRSI